MRQICIYLNGMERIVIYKEGGSQLERKVPGIGWCVDDETVHDWLTVLQEARIVLDRTISNIELVS